MNMLYSGRIAALFYAAGLWAAPFAPSFAQNNSSGTPIAASSAVEAEEALGECQRKLEFVANQAARWMGQKDAIIIELETNMGRLQAELDARPSVSDWERRKAELNGDFHNARQNAEQALDILLTLQPLSAD